MAQSLRSQLFEHSTTKKLTSDINPYLIQYSNQHLIQQNNKQPNLVGSYSPFIANNKKYKQTNKKLLKILEPQEFHSLDLETSNRVSLDFNAVLSNLFKDKYILFDSNKILQYLQSKRELIPFLLEAERQIRKVFISEKLVLKFIYDPEIINWTKLIVAIHTNLDANEAFDKLKLLDHSWWLEASYSINNDLDIHIDFDEI